VSRSENGRPEPAVFAYRLTAYAPPL
jgi:hypothetical protein